MSFKKEFQRVQRKAFENSKKKGFHSIDDMIDALPYDAIPVPLREARQAQRLMLIVSELGEALEAIRHGNPPDNHIPKFSGLEAELADAVIRIMDLAETHSLDLAGAIISKMSYNARREKMHGGKRF
jgi:NTP pyrophosphatase (non-canonical NTP hydrolase)